MKLPRLAWWCQRHILHRCLRRDADFTIGGRDRPYMLRWWITPWSGGHQREPAQRTRWQRIGMVLPLPHVYLHWILRSDDDRALHDHPWPNASLVLAGSYIEHTIAAGGIHRRTLRSGGDLVFRRARAAHRLEITPGEACWSLFLTGPKLRTWGFHCPERGWVPWREFTDVEDPGAVGKGCAE